MLSTQETDESDEPEKLFCIDVNAMFTINKSSELRMLPVAIAIKPKMLIRFLDISAFSTTLITANHPNRKFV